MQRSWSSIFKLIPGSAVLFVLGLLILGALLLASGGISNQAMIRPTPVIPATATVIASPTVVPAAATAVETAVPTVVSTGTSSAVG